MTKTTTITVEFEYQTATLNTIHHAIIPLPNSLPLALVKPKLQNHLNNEHPDAHITIKKITFGATKIAKSKQALKPRPHLKQQRS